MALLLQVLGVLAVAGVLRAATATLRWAAAVVLVANVLGAVALWNDAPSQTHAFITERSGPAPSPAARGGAGGGVFSANEGFLSWADGHIPRGVRVYLICRNPACAGGLIEWITYRLGPRPFVPRLRDAQYVVAYDATPRQAALPAATARAATRFAPRFLIAPVRG